MNVVAAPSEARVPARSLDALLIEPSPTVEEHVSALLAGLGLRVHVAEDLPPDLGGVSLLLVEADRGSRTIALARQARARWPELPCAAVLRWWNEDERELAALVDFILHVPVRPQELDGLASVALRARSGLPRPLAPRRPTATPAPTMALTGRTLLPALRAPARFGARAAEQRPPAPVALAPVSTPARPT
jgi:hypothetical protein